MPLPARPARRSGYTLSTLILFLVIARSAPLCRAQTTPPRDFNPRQLTAAGIRILEGRHVQLLTDLPRSPAVDELPQVFDAAIPQWAEYFEVDRNAVRGRWLAFLIKDREKFAALNLLPSENPNFINGYARGYELWLMEQPSDYYRRHLLLHEGTHAFMQTQLGGAGPGWYMEGTAELLGTHAWRNNRLHLRDLPATREAVPMWGRIKLIRDAVEKQQAWPLNAVLEVNNRRPLDTDVYAWTWALATLLDKHPRFTERFRALKEHVADERFNDRFREAFADDWSDLVVEWDVFVRTLDYGYDVERMATIHKPAEPIEGRSARTTIAADRGWQSTGWLLRAGREYRITASSRFQIAEDAQPWPSEPAGVTIEYHEGRPLGQLLGSLRTTGRSAGSFGEPIPIGLAATVKPEADAILYLRVNDSPARLGDNDGDVAVRIEPAPNR
ncbi:MAG TPA: hypothetical protein VF175_17715 [Lacipirellula sp.]